MRQEIRHMIIPEKLTIDILNKQPTLTELVVLVNEYKENNNIGDSRDLLIILEKLFAENSDFAEDHTELFEKYQQQLVLLKAIIISVLHEKEIIPFLKTGLLASLANDIDLMDKINTFFYLHKDNITGYEARKSFIAAVLQNNERFGLEKLEKDGGAKTEKPFIKNWLKDFYGSYPANKELTRLEEIEYASNNINAKSLSTDDKKILLKLLRFFNFLRFPQPLESVVRETGPAKTRTAPPVQKAPVKAEPAPVQKVEKQEEEELPTGDPITLLKQKYQVYRQQREVVLKLEDQLMVKTQGDPEAVKRELATASRNGDKNNVIACLKLLASQKVLADSLRQNPAWWKAVSDYITKKYSDKFNQHEVGRALVNAKINSTSPAVISEFLQYLLKEKLRISENDSALIGVELGQLLGDVYQSIAFGNPETGNFEWITNKIVEGDFISEAE